MASNPDLEATMAENQAKLDRQLAINRVIYGSVNPADENYWDREKVVEKLVALNIDRADLQSRIKTLMDERESSTGFDREIEEVLVQASKSIGDRRRSTD